MKGEIEMIGDIARLILIIVGVITAFVLMPFLIWAHPLAPLWIKIGMTVFLIVCLIAMGD